MPLTPELRLGIDRIRDYLFGGGYPNPAQNAGRVEAAYRRSDLFDRLRVLMNDWAAYVA